MSDRLFGVLLVLSFCDFNFVMKHFKFLKTVTGKGAFDIFLASMFLVGSEGDIWGWLMFGCFMALGSFFVLVGCACIEGYDDSDIKKKEVADKARSMSMTKKGESSQSQDDEALLSQ